MNQLPLSTPRALTRASILHHHNHHHRTTHSLKYSTTTPNPTTRSTAPLPPPKSAKVVGGGGGGGSKVLQTTLLLGGGGAAGLGAYYFYDPNAEVFKQARGALGLEQLTPSTKQEKKKVLQQQQLQLQQQQNRKATEVLSSPSPTTEQKKLIRSSSSSTTTESSKQTTAKDGISSKVSSPSSSSSVVQPLVSAAAGAFIADAAAAKTVVLPTPPSPTLTTQQQATNTNSNEKQDKQQQTSTNDAVVPKHVLVTALRAQQEALSESHESRIKTIQNEYDRRLSNATQVIEAERVVDLRAKYEKASAALQAIEQGIEARTDQNTRAKRLRALWAQVNAVYARVNHPEYHDSTTTTIDKSRLITAIEVEDMFVRQMVSSLPNQPVHSLESLKQRFYDDVEPLAKSVTLIKDGEGFSIWKYALGSLFAGALAKVNRGVVTETSSSLAAAASTSSTPAPSSPVQRTANSLDSARSALEKSDLLSAAIAVNQLTGLPRQVASDWLADARTLLETNQTLFVLMTYAASNNVF